MASSRAFSPSIMWGFTGQSAAAALACSATLLARARTTCSLGWLAFSRATASPNGAIRRAISDGRLPGSTSRIGSSGAAPRLSRSQCGSAPEKSLARVGLPTAVTFIPAFSK